METFVLVTGAWHGGWSWRPVATRLRAEGHRVLTPTLPGLALDDDPRGVTLTEPPDQKPFFALDVSSAYIRTTDDIALPPGEWGWDRFPSRPADPTIVEVPGSHEANFTRPGELAEAILAVSTAGTA